MTGRTFDQAVQLLNDRVNLERLQSFSPQDMEGRLDILQQILDSLSNPEAAYRTVHITGTKGKGSVCIMLESLFRQDGLRVGRFTSPHIDCFTERLSIDGVPCPAEEFTELFFSVSDCLAVNTLASLTYFELLTLLAFVYFARKKVDIALFEVGLGGRLDATNLCKPDVVVITSVSFDHMQQLGNTLASIATEKSGIIKPNIPVVTAVQDSEPLDVIRGKARKLAAPLYVLDEHFAYTLRDPQSHTFCYQTLPDKFPRPFTLEDITLTMPGKHQICNASAALSAYLLFQQNKQILSCEKIRAGLHQAFLPLRCEVIRPSAELPTLVFDGAHNRASMKAFVEAVSELFPNQRRILIFGTSQGKDIEGMYAEIAGYFDRIVLTQSSNLRCTPPQELRHIFASSDEIIMVNENARTALENCLHSSNPNDVICVTGSLYLAADLRQQYQSNTQFR